MWFKLEFGSWTDDYKTEMVKSLHMAVKTSPTSWTHTSTCDFSFVVSNSLVFHQVFKGSINVKVIVAPLCPAFCDPMDYSVHGILQARILEWVVFPFPRGSSQPRNWTWSLIAGGFFTSWATREAHLMYVRQILFCSFIQRTLTYTLRTRAYKAAAVLSASKQWP